MLPVARVRTVPVTGKAKIENPLLRSGLALAGAKTEGLSLETGAKFNGFTVTELLVVIAIIAILIGLLLPAVQSR